MTGTRSRRPVVMEVHRSHRSPIDAAQIPDNATSQPTPDKIGENAERDGTGHQAMRVVFVAEQDRGDV